jgi:hypothetical protein
MTSFLYAALILLNFLLLIELHILGEAIRYYLHFEGEEIEFKSIKQQLYIENLLYARSFVRCYG